jgi:hypothetical protein
MTGIKVFEMKYLVSPRFLVLVFWVAISQAAGLHGKERFGWGGYFLWFIVVFSILILLTWALLLGRILIFYPFPKCKSGKCCKLNDYTWRKGAIFGYEGSGNYEYRCKCGDYLTRIHKRFFTKLPDGTLKPFKKLTGFRRWEDDIGD